MQTSSASTSGQEDGNLLFDGSVGMEAHEASGREQVPITQTGEHFLEEKVERQCAKRVPQKIHRRKDSD